MSAANWKTTIKTIYNGDSFIMMENGGLSIYTLSDGTDLDGAEQDLKAYIESEDMEGLLKQHFKG